MIHECRPSGTQNVWDLLLKVVFCLMILVLKDQMDSHGIAADPKTILDNVISFAFK